MPFCSPNGGPPARPLARHTPAPAEHPEDAPVEVPATKAVWAAQTPNTNCPHTIGVQEEFVLIDPVTGHPALSNTADVAATAEMGVDLQRELPRAVHRYSPLRTPLPATFPGEAVGLVLVEPEHEDYDAFEAQ